MWRRELTQPSKTFHQLVYACYFPVEQCNNSTQGSSCTECNAIVSQKRNHGRSILQVCQRMRVGYTVSSGSAFNAYVMFTTRCPRSTLLDTQQRATEPSPASKSSPDGTQHSEWHHITMSMVYLAVRTAINYVQMPLVLYYTKFLTSGMHSAWGSASQTLLKAHSKVGTPLSKLWPCTGKWAKSRGWAIFRETGI